MSPRAKTLSTDFVRANRINNYVDFYIMCEKRLDVAVYLSYLAYHF